MLLVLFYHDIFPHHNDTFLIRNRKGEIVIDFPPQQQIFLVSEFCLLRKTDNQFSCAGVKKLKSGVLRWIKR